MGEPDGERATKRALEGICETIDECEKNSKRTAVLFTAWLQTVRNVEKAVIGTLSKTAPNN